MIKLGLFISIIASLSLSTISCQKDNSQACKSKRIFTDLRDNKEYEVVTIGEQTWFAQNLAYAPSEGNYWAYNNDKGYVDTYGYLYDWETAVVSCPKGWHLPTAEEWWELFDHLGGSDVAGGKMKSNLHWNQPNTGATNESCFSALPAGYMSNNEQFKYIGQTAIWWASIRHRANNCLEPVLYHGANFGLTNDAEGYFGGSGPDYLGKSCRCIED